MKIALIKTKSGKNNTTPRYKSSIYSKEDPSNQNHELVPNFAARWRSICKYLDSSGNKRSENDARYNNNIKKTPRAYTQKKKTKGRFRTIKSKPS